MKKMSKNQKCQNTATPAEKRAYGVWAKMCRTATLETFRGSKAGESVAETLLAGREVINNDPRRKAHAITITTGRKTKDGATVLLHTSLTPNEGHKADGVAQVLNFIELGGAVVKSYAQGSAQVARACGCVSLLKGATLSPLANPYEVADLVAEKVAEGADFIAGSTLAELLALTDARQNLAISATTVGQFYNYKDENYGDQKAKKTKRKEK